MAASVTELELPVADLHVDTISRLLEVGGEWDGARPELEVDAPRCADANIRLLLTALFTRDDHPEPGAYVDQMLRRAHELNQRSECPLQQVRSVADLQDLGTGAGVRSDGRVGFLVTIENAIALGEGAGLDRIGAWYEAGVRIVGLTWNGTNCLASGVSAERDEGLTDLGEQAVQELTRTGMAVDLSHLAPLGVSQVLDTEVPVLATHCNARSIQDHPRNLTDDQLRRLATRGGVVGLNMYPPFLTSGPARLRDVALHAAHIAEVMGPERLALGTDLDGIDRFPQDFPDYRGIPALVAELKAIGFSDSEVRGILFDNFGNWWSRWSQ